MTRPRYLLMAMPPKAVLDAMLQFVEHHQLDKQLGPSLFQPTNWHQSLSDRYWEEDVPEVREQLLRASARISAQSVALALNRIVSQGPHWAFRARGKPAGFADLLAAIRTALAAEGIMSGGPGHTPHVTLSYRAPGRLPSMKITPPIAWLIDEILLVKGIGTGPDYRYEIVGRRQLDPVPPGPQLNLFPDD